MIAAIRSLLSRLRHVFPGAAEERDLDFEARSHIAAEAERLAALGVDSAEARRLAHLSFGGLEQTKEAIREARSLPFVEVLAKDLSFAARVLRKSPGFSILAILALALGMGAASAVFSVANAVLLRPLPFPAADRLVLVRQRVLKIGKEPLRVPAPDSVVYCSSSVFETCATVSAQLYDISGGAAPEQVAGERVSAGLFAMLGAAPLVGRVFDAAEEHAGRKLVVVSYGYWVSRLGRDPQAVGRRMLLNREPYEIAGVLPESFVFPRKGMIGEQPAAIFTPLSLQPEERVTYVDNPGFTVIGRLRPAVTLARVQAEMALRAREIESQYPAEMKRALPPDFHPEALVTPMQEEISQGSQRLLGLLLAAVACLVSIACANVANMLLARGSARSREMAVRAALGASRLRIARQLLTESALLAALGAGLGLLVTWVATRWLAAFLPAEIPLSGPVAIDYRVLFFCAALALLTGILCGISPALALTRGDLGDPLKDSAKGSTGGRRAAVAFRILVLIETALALVLATGSGLLIRSFAALRASDPGFAPERVLTFAVNLAQAEYGARGAARSFYQRLLPRILAAPGVRAAAAASDLPYSGNWGRVYHIEGSAGGALLTANNSLVLGDYFQALRIPLRRGRTFTAADVEGAPLAVVVNETFARRYLPGADPIGRRFAPGTPKMRLPWLTVVGVVGDVKEASPERPAAPHVYVPYLQAEGFSWTRRLKFIVRAEGDAAALGNSMRAAVAGLDAELPVTNIQTVAEILDERLSSRRVTMWLVTGFAVAALVLAGLGIYGVMAYSVGRRTAEIGIRLALGARPASIVRMVVFEGMRLVALGMAAGVAVSVALGRVMGSLLYGVSGLDLATYAVTAGVLGLVALVAHYVPARRATAGAVMEALRHE